MKRPSAQVGLDFGPPPVGPRPTGRKEWRRPIAAKPRGWTPPSPPDLSGETELFVDAETTGLKWWGGDLPAGWAIMTREGRGWYLPLRHAGGANLDPGAFRRWALSREGLAGKRLVGLNVRFDAHHARADGMDLAAAGCSFGDVGHYAALLNEYRRSFSLESIAMEALGRGKLELDVTHGAHVYAPWEIEEYALNDVDLPRLVLASQRPRLEAEGLTGAAALEDSVIPAVVEMEANGAPLDVDKLARWCVESERDLLEALSTLDRLAGFECNPSSGPDMERLFGKLGIRPPTTAGGSPSFTEEVLAKWAPKHAAVRAAQAARKIDSLRVKFLLKYRDTTDRTGGVLRYALNQMKADDGGTVTGRFSSSSVGGKGEDEEGANVQQVIRVSTQRKVPEIAKYVIRELYVAPPGRVVYDADAAQIEYRLFANRARPRDLLEQYARDPWTNYHKYVIPMVQAVCGDIDYDGGKKLNFSKLYGGGAATICRQLGVAEAVAKRFIQAYDRAFPAAKRALQEAADEAEANGYVTTLLGRRARFVGRQRLHKALNSIIQGSAADVMKTKLAALYRERNRLGLTMRMTVHDEVVGDVENAAAGEAVTRFLNEQDFALEVPILWEGGVGPNWAEAKH